MTAPDGAVQTIEGYDPVGTNPRLGKRAIGDFSAEVGGDHQVQCSGVQEAWVSDESDPQRGSLLAIPSLAVVFLLVGVLPVAVISLVVWRPRCALPIMSLILRLSLTAARPPTLQGRLEWVLRTPIVSTTVDTWLRGDKSTQQDDIAKAHELAAEWHATEEHQ